MEVKLLFLGSKSKYPVTIGLSKVESEGRKGRYKTYRVPLRVIGTVFT